MQVLGLAISFNGFCFCIGVFGFDGVKGADGID